MTSSCALPEVTSLDIDIEALSRLGNFKAQFKGETVPELKKNSLGTNTFAITDIENVKALQTI